MATAKKLATSPRSPTRLRLEGSKAFRAGVEEALSGASLEFVDGTGGSFEFDVLLADGRKGELSETALAGLAKSPDKVLVVIDDSDSAMGLVRAHPPLRHLVAKSAYERPRLLETTIEKCVRGPLWDPLAHFPEGAKTRTLTVDDYSRKGEYLKAAGECAAEAGGFSGLDHLVKTVTSELVMNAIFDAPVREGRPLYRDVSREENVRLGPEAAARLVFAWDDRLLSVSITDQFGSLSASTIAESLGRAAGLKEDRIRKQSAGAGIGLFLMYHTASQLDFQLAPGSRTSVTAFFHLSKRLKEFDAGGHSLHIFKGQIQDSDQEVK